MRSRWKVSQLMRTIVIDILIILIILVITSLFFYTIYSNRYKTEIDRVYKESILNTKTILDNNIVIPMIDIYSNIAFDFDNVGYNNPYHFTEISSDSMHVWDIYKIHKGLKELEVSNKQLFNSLGIYYPKQKLLITSKDYFCSLTETNSVKWTKDMETAFSAGAINFENDTNIISTLRPLPLNSDFDSAKAFVNIQLRMEYINKLINNEELEHIYMLNIYNSIGELIYSNEKSTRINSQELKVDIHNIQENSVIQANCDDLIYSYILSEDKEYTYCFIMDKSEYYISLIKLQRQYLLVILILFFVAITVVICISCRMYAPLEVLVNQAKDILENENIDDIDEYKAIHYMIERLNNKVINLNASMGKYLPVIESNFYMNLLRGVAKDVEIRNKTKLFNIVQRNYYRVLIIFIEKIIYGTNLELAQMDIINFIENLTLKQIDAYKIIDNRNKLIIILRYDEPGIYDVFIKKLNEYMASVYSSRQHTIDYSICCGKQYCGLDLIYKSYQEAKQVNSYSFIYSGALEYDRFEFYKRKTFSEIINEGEMEKVIVESDVDCICEYISKLISIIKQSHIDIESVNEIVNEVEMRTKLLVSNENITNIDKLLSEFDMELKNMKKIDDLVEIYRTLIENLRMLEEDSRTMIRREFATGIIEYIKDNLDKDVSLTELSEKFNMSYSYLSKKIKETTGETFSRYLLRVRLEKACYLLENSDDIIDVIASKTGFNDTGYFIKQFKKHNRMTPGEYRKICYKNNYEE